jgi:high-affinity K+ transport system ATPase subunit B
MSNFWDVIWVVIWSFVFIAYLMIFFRILMDLFSDHQLSGWFKALWIIFLIFVPFLAAFIYLIARGRGMAERQVARIREAQSQTDAYIKQVAGSGGGGSAAQHIADAKSLLDSGAITQAEFEKLKAKALA